MINRAKYYYNEPCLFFSVAMNVIVKHFSELSTEELFRIYKLRVAVFVVE